jgi:hypothetical protein
VVDVVKDWWHTWEADGWKDSVGKQVANIDLLKNMRK